MKENRVLTIDNLTTTFESHKQKIQAVRGVSLHVDEGDILAIVGESGSGKSVTMKSVMGLLGENADVQADHLELLQKDLLSMSEKEKRKMRGKDMAMIFQDPMTSLNPIRTIGSQITEVIEKHQGISRGDAKKLAASAAQLEQIENILCQIYAERTGRTVEDIRDTYMDGADHWLTADEALALGFVDEIFDDPSAEAITDSLTPQQRCDRYTARYLDSIVPLNTEKQMFEKIKGMPTFSDCADEAAAVARVADIAAKAKERDALAKEIEVLRNKVSEYEEKERSAQEAAYDAEVDAALKEERISATEADSFKALMRKDPENTRALLSSRKPKRRATSVIDTAGSESKTDKDYLAEREAEVRAKLEK